MLLQRVMLPYTLHTIHSKAFMSYAALQELAIPPSLHYIGLQSLLGLHSLERAYANARQKKYMERDLCRGNGLCTLSEMAPATVASPYSRSGIRVGLGLSPNKPHRRCHVEGALHQCSPTALSNHTKERRASQVSSLLRDQHVHIYTSQ